MNITALLTFSKKCFGDRISDEEISDMPVYDAEVLKTFQTKMTICVVIAIISSVNITALFKYVIDLRRKTMAIISRELQIG